MEDGLSSFRIQQQTSTEGRQLLESAVLAVSNRTPALGHEVYPCSGTLRLYCLPKLFSEAEDMMYQKLLNS